MPNTQGKCQTPSPFRFTIEEAPPGNPKACKPTSISHGERHPTTTSSEKEASGLQPQFASAPRFAPLLPSIQPPDTVGVKRRRLGEASVLDPTAWTSKDSSTKSQQARRQHRPPSPVTPQPTSRLPNRTTPPVSDHSRATQRSDADESRMPPSFQIAPHFSLHPSRSSNTVPTSDPTSTPSLPSARSRYILPATEEATPPVLLPDAFSPHRRRERFVPGGWASTVRSWIVDASSSASTSSLGAGRAAAQTGITVPSSAASDGSVRVRIDEVRGSRAGGLTLARGAVLGEGGRMVDVMLAGDGGALHGLGGARAGASEDLRAGMRVQLSPPMWDLCLPSAPPAEGTADGGGERTWLVCATWKVM